MGRSRAQTVPKEPPSPGPPQHGQMGAVVRWGSPGVQGAPTGFVVPHSPRKVGPLTRAVNDHQRPNSWVLPDCLVSTGNCLSPPGAAQLLKPWRPVCCPLPTLAIRPEEGADRGGPGSSPALRPPRSAPSGPVPSCTGSAKQRAAVAERPLASRAPWARWPRGRVRLAARSRKGRPPRPRTAPRVPKARASPHLACAVWSGTARQRAARRPGRKRGLAPEATQTLPGSSRTLEDPALCDPRAGGAQLRSPDFVPKGPRRNRYVCPSLRDALTVTVPR